MAIIRKLAAKRRGFTLIELMIVVVIIGVLAALAIYGVQKYVANAKSAEARLALGRISKDSLSAFEREGMTTSIVTLGESASITRRLCASATAAIPAGINTFPGFTTAPTGTPAAIQAKKYQSKPSEWKAGDQNTGWACLKTQMVDPTYFAYGYTASASVPAAVSDSYTAFAVGDLNGDGTGSLFWLTGLVQQEAGSGPLVLTTSPSIGELNPEE